MSSVIVALFAGLVMVALGAIDIGNLFYARRSLQRVADLAALAAVQTLDDTCTQPPLTARANADANGFSATAQGQSLDLACGRWDTSENNGPSYFSSASGQAPLNAVQVTATRPVPYIFFGPARTISASATAQATNLGAFTVGTALAQLQGGLVNALLNALLGGSVNLSLASYESLANARVKLGDLAAALGVSTVDQLLAARVSAAGLAQLMLTALSNTSVADANLQTDLATLQAIVAGGMSNAISFPIGDSSDAHGLLSLGLADSQSALDATISPFDALMVAAQIAKAGQPPIDVSAGVQLPGADLSLLLQIIEPPVLAVGEAGIDPATRNWRTMAHTAQLRLYMNIGLSLPPLPLIGQVALELPISLEAVPGNAWLESISCASSKPASRSTIGATPGLANICIAKRPANLAASQPFSCSQPATLVDVPNLIEVTAALPLTATVGPADSPSLSFDGVSGNDDDYQSADSNAVGGILANALTGLATSLAQPGALSIRLFGLPSSLLDSLTGALVSLLSTLLSPVLIALDAVVEPLLQLLGVQIGVAEIHDLSLTCGVSKLVY
ncbi:TadG family pilus assembly protein [Trinickia caryophylli]|uniref:TadG family pilus assembly protein n=1 Tax=Trinickia caryophylli TaxID=28094 RepID=UPI001E5CE042|nr:TadG family pilus assembly protein [Trinickia caryophylli]WQE11677.1 TadG family pilus assembly protein [Trinickia caryophylli]GLU34863.1 membrane protein [Trinickia caryophylli]